ncbi:DUF1642 domain-containing protein [uncultured Streptococcus sp.]|uniref:DUF1642 domain-containing protein n=1 Tax=uncultured Streptococcus sp. TaxID=83427 RepID=UPI0028D0BC62|nr:DUF1642 domain-containing protein [uncultured Streptococcus sp.]
MNIKALIKKYEAVECVVGIVSGKTILKTVLRDLKQLDEPEKVKVPQFVADWIEVCKAHLTSSLYTAMNPNFMKENNQSFDLILWIKKTSNQDLFVRAWLDGYEVEKEKRYTVVTKATKQPLYYNAMDKKLFFSMGGLATKFTRKQLEEADFGWVFDCEGVEVQEVEG